MREYSTLYNKCKLRFAHTAAQRGPRGAQGPKTLFFDGFFGKMGHLGVRRHPEARGSYLAKFGAKRWQHIPIQARLYVFRAFLACIHRPHCAVLQFQQATLCGYHTVWVCGHGARGTGGSRKLWGNGCTLRGPRAQTQKRFTAAAGGQAHPW